MTEILDVAKKDGRWTECPACSEIIITHKLEESLWVCPHCDHHFRLTAAKRLALLCDPDSFVELGAEYADEALVGGTATIEGQACLVAVMDFACQGGTMGVSLGEKIGACMQQARAKGLTLIMLCASGGVRVQEGIWGLMQMLRTVHVRNVTAQVPMITVFTDPTMGGVTASFAGLADIILAEPGARIGFAGPRVIESTINYKLPPDFQDARRLLENGLIDRIVHRRELRATLAYLLEWFSD